jgi:hypothetical protein
MTHSFKFVRAGGFDQVQITTGADLKALPELDQKLWVALACPTTGIEFDARTLELLDIDKDKRIRAPELIAAVKWACDNVKDADTLVDGEDALELASINDGTVEGKLLLKTAKTILKTLGLKDAKSLSVEDASKASAAFDKDPFNGDGIIVEAGVEGDALKATFKDILLCTATPDKDKSGENGLGEATIQAFFKEIAAHAAWLKSGEEAANLPLGDKTVAAYSAFSAVRAKVADYFARAKVAAYDPRALAAVNGEEKQYLELAAKDLEVSAAEVEKLPLAQVAADKPLALSRGINPAWADRVLTFKTQVVEPIVGAKDTLSEADWTTIAGKFTAHAAWVAAKTGAPVEKLGAPRVRELADGDHEKKLLALVAEDKDKEPEAKAIESVEKLVRLNRDLMTLVNNFVAFRDFYSREAPAMFQIGTLYLDTRACELCVKVDNAGKHASMAPLSNTYLVYCDLKNAKGETMQIAAAMTAGDIDNLMVGRNGIFYDRKGNDWDATINKIIDNPISIRQAFWSPYKKVLRMIEERIAKRAADEAAAQDATLTTGVDHAATVTAGEAPPTPPPAPRGMDIGTVAALGVAVGGITAALGALLSAFFGLGMWMPLGVVGLILCISGPSMAVAWLKLRKRNLGPILDANGWAVNAQAVVNVPLGASLTKEAVLPPGSSRDMTDPFAEKKRPWGFYVFLVVLLALGGAWYLGKLNRFLPPAAHNTVLGEYAPSAEPEEESETAAEAPAAGPAPTEAAPAAPAP